MEGTMRISNMINTFALSAETVEKISQDVLFDISRFPSALKHMGIGMLGIFIVIGVIILAVYSLELIIRKIEARKQKESEE